MDSMIDYYSQNYDFLTLVENLGGCIEDRDDLSLRAKKALHDRNYFYVKCKNGTIRLKGIDEISRAIDMPLRLFK